VDAYDQAQITFIIGATWPDLIKKFQGNCPKQPKPNSGPLYNYTYCNDTDDPTRSGAAAGQNVGYTDPLEHKYWHFYDQPFSTDGTPTTAPVAPNAKTQIGLLRTAIADDSTPDALESYDMVWLEHMVGDVHQPLHAVQRYSADLPNGDIGGNAVCTGTHMGKDPKTGKPKCSSELHAFWDNALGVQVSPGALPALKKKKKAPAKIGIDAYNAYQAIDAAAALSATPPASDVDIADEDKWLDESFTLATQNAYSAPVGAGIGPYALDAAYTDNTRKITELRAELAGERLAKLLDEHLH
jgi:hypothetical protein